jgi:hypothetical protein
MPVPIETPNFAFLGGVHERLHTYALGAELLCMLDPGACLARLRKLAEWMAEALARQSGIDAGDRFADVERRLEDLGEVEPGIITSLRLLRTGGNKALHRHGREPRVEEAVEGLRVAWGLCKAYARHVGRGEGLPRVFVSPADPRAVVREAQERLIEVKEENVQLRAKLARRPESMPVEALAGRLRELAVQVRTPLQFAGLAHRGHGADVTIEEIYVHRSFSMRDGSTIDHEGLLADFEADVAPRYVILGAAGAGKTTLCRRLVGALGQRGRIGLFVRLRALGDVGGELDAMLDAGARWICAQTSLVVTAEDVARLLDAGSTVMLFDGFDELTSPDARAQTAERLLAFAVRFPGVPVVVTSREQVLHQTPLDPRFVPLQLDPFTLADAARLTTRLFAAAGLGDAASACALVEQLSERARLREMLWTPLTVTLLAFQRADGADLPAGTCAVLEQWVRTWTERWPRVTDRPRSPIDRGHERAVLERVARALVERAEHGCALEFGGLVREVAGEIRRADPTVAQPEAEMRAEEWIDHQLAHIGLLEEDDRGYVYFAHWSLMQYLAACASSADEIAAWAAELAHQDLCYLACELHGEDEGFLARVAEVVVAASDEEAASWLLRAAIEGAPFSAAAVIAGCERLMHAHRRETSWRSRRAWSFSPRAHVELATLLLARPAYATALQVWARAGLEEWRGEALLRAVIWGMPVFGVTFVLAALSGRVDRELAAEDLLPLWPANEIGMSLVKERKTSCDEISAWVVQHIDAAGALRWARSLGDEDLMQAATACLVLACGPYIAAALGVAVAARTLALGFTGAGALTGFCRRRGRSRTDAIAMPGKVRIQLGFRTPVRPRIDARRATWRRPPELSDGITAALRARYKDAWGHIMQPPGACAEDVPLPQVEWSPERPDVSLDEFVAAGHTLCEEPREMIMLGILGVPLNLEELWGRRLEVTPVRAEPTPTPQAGIRVPVSLYLRKDDPRAARFDLHAWSGHYGELLLALFASAGLADDQRRMYIRHRLQDRWVLEAWPLLEVRWWTAERTDTGAALLLALGWGQFASTGQWPDTRLWADLVSPRRETPWLVRVHQHLCWLACDRKAAGHRAGLRQALYDGTKDPEFGVMAAALRELLADER